MRQEEEMCRETFDEYLARKLSPEERRWDKGDEPPDYYLKVGSTKYAVEVTTVRHHYVMGSEQLPILSVVLALSRLVQKVEEQASREGVLSGTYFVHLEAITNLGRFQDRISKGLLNFVRRTQADESASNLVRSPFFTWKGSYFLHSLSGAVMRLSPMSDTLASDS